ncbi:MAG TPA: hypothetical protein VEX62_04175 [Candidatus Limnocylindrales bacterium]|nr:hypothetical protein [Candidatus Limnocylindrales bacterium]
MTEDAIVLCTHQLGTVTNQPSQGLVTIDGRKVLVDNDPESRSIRLCPNIGVTMKPCTTTLKVVAGYSTFVKIDGKSACLQTVTGMTDGTPPGIVQYQVRYAGQALLDASG